MAILASELQARSILTAAGEMLWEPSATSSLSWLNTMGFSWPAAPR